MPRFKIPTGVKIFAVIWLLILALPITREVFQAYLYSDRASSYFRTGSVSTHEELAERLHRQHPDSIEMALWYSQLTYWRQGNDRTLANLDVLRKKFPKNLQIAAVEIQLICNEIPRNNTPKKTGAVKIELMKKAAKIAFESGQKQPENVFWPLMESGFYYYAKQKPKAWEAMKRLNRCTAYDDFNSQLLKERMQFIESHEPINWEKKIAIWASTLYPHLWVLSMACDAATDEAVKVKKQGRDGQALELIAPMLKGLGIMSRDSQVHIGSLVAESRAYGSLKVFFERREPRGTFTYDGRGALQKELAQSWTQFSNENGHPEFASSADFITRKQNESEQYLYRANPEDSLGLRPPWGLVALSALPILFWISVLSLASGFIWGFNTLVFKHDTGDHQPPRGQITSCVLFSFWAIFGLIVTAFYLRWLILNNLFGGYPTQSTSVFLLMLPILIVGLWLLPVYYQSQKRKVWRIKVHPVFDEKDRFTPLSTDNLKNRKIAWIAFLLGSQVMFWTGATGYSILIAMIGAATSIVSLVIALRLEFLHQRAKRFIKSDLKIDSTTDSLKTRVLRLILWGACLMCFILVMVQLPWEAQRADLVLWTILGVGSLFGAIFNESKANIAGFAFARKLATQSAGVFAILWGLTFIAGSIGLWPLRAELNKQWERRLSMSEVDWAKEQYEKNK